MLRFQKDIDRKELYVKRLNSVKDELQYAVDCANLADRWYEKNDMQMFNHFMGMATSTIAEHQSVSEWAFADDLSIQDSLKMMIVDVEKKISELEENISDLRVRG